MEKLDKIEERLQEEKKKLDEELKLDEYPDCPHGSWQCPYKPMWPMFKEFGADYMGHVPTCNLCVQWAQVKQWIKIERALILLRYSG